MALFQSAGKVLLFIVMSRNCARYRIMASPPNLRISPEIPSGPIDLFFPVAATLVLMIFVSVVKGWPELAHCICWMLPSLLNAIE